MKKVPKTYDEEEAPISLLQEPAMPYPLQNFELIRLSRKGILKKNILQLAKKLSFTLQEIAGILHISERTLQRYNNEDTLASDTSERALLLAQLYDKGISVFGTADNFNDWLRTPLPAFQQEAPMQYLDTAFGFQLISDELGRIEHGIYA
jgi:putative toxin-antitoxin system antitoxin component (TIGR02293 family)